MVFNIQHQLYCYVFALLFIHLSLIFSCIKEPSEYQSVWLNLTCLHDGVNSGPFLNEKHKPYSNFSIL